MALEGSLQDMSLTDLFQIFRTGSKTGVLILNGGSERGIIYVHKGQLVDAVLVRGTERQIIATAEEAVLLLLQWEQANFTFRHDLTVAERRACIVHDIEWLVIEGLKRRENPFRMLPHQQITLDARFELAPLPSSAETGVNLDLDQWRVLSQIAICQDLREIIARTGLTADQGVRISTELLAIGLIEIVQPPKPASQARPTARQRIPDMLYTQQLTPAYANTPELPQAESNQTSGHGLLGAIMRRIRGL